MIFYNENRILYAPILSHSLTSLLRSCFFWMSRNAPPPPPKCCVASRKKAAKETSYWLLVNWPLSECQEVIFTVEGLCALAAVAIVEMRPLKKG